MCRPVTRNLLILSCGVCLFAASGCSAFRSELPTAMVAEPLRHLPEIQKPPAADAPPADPLSTVDDEPKATPDDSSCYVEIWALGEAPKRIRMSLDDATHVQKVLDHTGLVKTFKEMDIELSRKLPNGARRKLEVHYDTKRNQVVSAFDYALHPHDLLVVRQVSATSFDGMLKKLAGPLAR